MPAAPAQAAVQLPGSEPGPTLSSREVLKPATAELYNVRFSAGQEFKEKLDRLAEVLGVENPQGHLADIFEKALDLALDQKAPERRKARRESRKKKEPRSPRPDEARNGRSRYVPAALRDHVLSRASYQCEYRGPTGVRCSTRAGLEVDHIQPFGRGGGCDEGNLRALCQAHNLWCAEEVYGEEFIRRKIADKALTFSA